MKISLAIPNRNQSSFLPTALESLRYQSGKIELAVVDAGSTDGFEESIRPYRDLITYLRSRPDSGQSSAINEGLASNTGEIVSWLNADDYYFPGALDRVIEVFESDPSLDVVYGDAVFVTPDGQFLTYFPAIEPYDPSRLWRSCFICQPSCFMRRRVFEEVGGLDEALHYTMDWDLWCRLTVNRATFSYLPELLAAVRVYPQAKTYSGGWRRYREIIRIERRYGRSVVPTVWLRFYAYNLAQKSSLSTIESCLLTGVSILKAVRRLWRNPEPGPSPPSLYGFLGPEPVVDRVCSISLPWYKGSIWRTAQLWVEPSTGTFQAQLNDQACPPAETRSGYLEWELPPDDSILRTFKVVNLDGSSWKLKRILFT